MQNPKYREKATIGLVSVLTVAEVARVVDVFLRVGGARGRAIGVALGVALAGTASSRTTMLHCFDTCHVAMLPSLCQTIL